jgi:hypothetical protein
MERLGLENTNIAAICERMTMDAIGVAGFGKYLSPSPFEIPFKSSFLFL